MGRLRLQSACAVVCFEPCVSEDLEVAGCVCQKLERLERSGRRNGQRMMLVVHVRSNAAIMQGYFMEAEMTALVIHHVGRHNYL